MATQADIEAFMAEEFPQNVSIIERVGNRSATMRHRVSANDLRPGGTVSGPVMMMLADVALYVAILGEIGIVPLTVTTSLNFNFMRKPSAHADLLAVCTLMKVGRTLAIGEVALFSEGSEDMVAHAVGTYAIPRATA